MKKDIALKIANELEDYIIPLEGLFLKFHKDIIETHDHLPEYYLSNFWKALSIYYKKSGDNKKEKECLKKSDSWWKEYLKMIDKLR